MFIWNSARFIATLGLLIGLAAPALAASSGWIDANELERFSHKMASDDQIPTAIKCKDAAKVKGMDRRNTLVNVTYRGNQERTRWRWAWGNRVGQTDKRLTRDGFKRVSMDSYRRPSGLTVRCAIWHRKR